MFLFSPFATSIARSFRKLSHRDTHSQALPKNQETLLSTVDVGERSRREQEYDNLTLDEQRNLSLPEQFAILDRKERWWRDISSALETCGYRLRPRYQPDWQASWLTTGEAHWFCEDGAGPKDLRGHVLDAIRLEDGHRVCLKRFNRHAYFWEVDMSTTLRSGSHAFNPTNHNMHVHEVIRAPAGDDFDVLVLPRLKDWNGTGWDNFGEVVDFIGQALEGIQYMHKHGMAHRDCHSLNIMMDARGMYPEGWHFTHLDYTEDFKPLNSIFTRTERPPKYYWIDFGVSATYDRSKPTVDAICGGGDKNPPEHQNRATMKTADPFPTDIFYLGNLFQEHFLDSFYGFDSLIPLVKDMTQENPTKRPTIDEVVRRFRNLRDSYSRRKLRSRIIMKDMGNLSTSACLTLSLEPPSGFARHWWNRVGYTLRGIPPLPARPRRTFM